MYNSGLVKDNEICSNRYRYRQEEMKKLINLKIAIDVTYYLLGYSQSQLVFLT
jgi:hypothetical protein